jgi:aconitate hydratase
MLAAGLLAKKAVEKGLHVRPEVKTSLAPGSRVVSRYLEKDRPAAVPDKLGFTTVVWLHHLHRQLGPAGAARRAAGH